MNDRSGSDEARLDALLAACAAGDREAFRQLYQAGAPRLFGLLLRMLGRRDEAEDVLQEVFVTVWKRAGQFRSSRGSASTWLTSIARNRAIDTLRKTARRPRSAVEPDELPGRADPLGEVALGQSSARLRECLELLGDDYRHSLALAFFEGLSHSEVAARLGRPLGTVKSWIRRGLESLRGCLEA